MCTCMPMLPSLLSSLDVAWMCLSECLVSEGVDEESECLGVINIEARLLAAEDKPCVGDSGGDEVLEVEGKIETEREAEVDEAASGTLSVRVSGAKVVVE